MEIKASLYALEMIKFTEHPSKEKFVSDSLLVLFFFDYSSLREGTI